jgi:hypothetical protein
MGRYSAVSVHTGKGGNRILMAVQKDNSTFGHKVALRRSALLQLELDGIRQPVVMETHGGMGAIFDACYAHLPEGVVFEKDPEKAAILGKQRPTWAVYEAECEPVLAEGVGSHLQIDLLDIDPYGEPWPVFDAFFQSSRPFAPVMAIAVNDGLRQGLAMGQAWNIQSMAAAVERHGNDLHPIYLEICREMVAEKVAYAGYRLGHFGGYYCGNKKSMTHYLAVIRR